MGLDFYRRTMELVEKYRRPGMTFLHTMQTNGTLLDDEWATFFAEHNFCWASASMGCAAARRVPRRTREASQPSTRSSCAGCGFCKSMVWTTNADYCQPAPTATTCWKSTVSARRSGQ